MSLQKVRCEIEIFMSIMAIDHKITRVIILIAFRNNTFLGQSRLKCENLKLAFFSNVNLFFLQIILKFVNLWHRIAVSSILVQHR